MGEGEDIENILHLIMMNDLTRRGRVSMKEKFVALPAYIEGNDELEFEGCRMKRNRPRERVDCLFIILQTT